MQDWIDCLTLRSSPATVKAYTAELRRLAARFPDRALRDLTAADLTHYLAERKVAGAGAASLYRSVNAIRSYYAHAQGAASIAARVVAKRPAKRVQRTLTRGEARRLLCSFDTSRPMGRRNLALCALMIDSALRAAEVCRLETTQVDLGALLLWVRVKGGQEQFRAFSEETAAYIAAWVADRRAVARCNRLFVALGGTQGGLALTPDGLRTVFHSIGLQADISGLSPHVLRRTFATVASLLGGPTRIVQEGGGWGSMEQVLDYTRALQVEAIRPYLPVAAIMRAAQTGAPLEPDA